MEVENVAFAVIEDYEEERGYGGECGCGDGTAGSRRGRDVVVGHVRELGVLSRPEPELHRIVQERPGVMSLEFLADIRLGDTFELTR